MSIACEEHNLQVDNNENRKFYYRDLHGQLFIHNEFYDYWLKKLSNKELKVIWTVMRTEKDGMINLEIINEHTSLPFNVIIKILKKLIKNNLIGGKYVSKLKSEEVK